jgi:hypothetical protein
MTLKECFAVRDLDTFAAAFADEVGSVDRTSVAAIREAHEETHRVLEFVSELVFRARIYAWAMSKLPDADASNPMRELLHDRLCTISAETRTLYERGMRAIGIAVPWEDVVTCTLRNEVTRR